MYSSAAAGKRQPLSALTFARLSSSRICVMEPKSHRSVCQAKCGRRFTGESSAHETHAQWNGLPVRPQFTHPKPFGSHDAPIGLARLVQGASAHLEDWAAGFRLGSAFASDLNGSQQIDGRKQDSTTPRPTVGCACGFKISDVLNDPGSAVTASSR